MIIHQDDIYVLETNTIPGMTATSLFPQAAAKAGPDFTRLLDLALTTYILYVVHLMVAVPMLVLEVPFSKWAHLAFRPVVIYLTKVKELYQKEKETFA